MVPPRDAETHIVRERAAMATVYEVIAWTMRGAEAEEPRVLDSYVGDWREAEGAREHAHGRRPVTRKACF